MSKIKPASAHAKKLYRILKERGIACWLEHWDEYKHVDMCLPDAKLYIEVDGPEHYLNAKQIIADIKRDRYSEKEGFDTFRVNNEMIDEHLDELADAIEVVARERTKNKIYAK